jgi:hypothetical protein
MTTARPFRATADATGGPTASRSQEWDRRHLCAVMFRLALGRPSLSVPPGMDWTALLRFALEERCAALAWHRSGAEIRRLAPAAVIAQWRAAAIACDTHGARQLSVLATTIQALADVGVEPVILKGQPLSQRLYGVPTLRGSADLDIFVAEASRPVAERTLDAMGWSALEGNAPWTQTRGLLENGTQHFLELHSSLLDVNLLHLGAPAPRARMVAIDGHDLPAHDDALVPGYLASHAAKHMPIALLYHVDFLTLWSGLAEAERCDAVSAATRTGLAGYLRWAIGCADAVARAADGDIAALRILGIGPERRRVYHAVFRDIALAQTPLDGCRALAAWLWPPPLRHGLAPLARRWAARFRKSWADYVLPTRRGQARHRV